MSPHPPLAPAGDRHPGAVAPGIRQRDSFPSRFVAWRCVGREVLTQKREVPETEGEGIGRVGVRVRRVDLEVGGRTDVDPGTKPIVTRIYRTVRTLDGQAKNRLQYKPASFRLRTCPPAVWISIFYSPSSTLLFHCCQ